MNLFLVIRNNFKRSYNRRTSLIVNFIIPIIVVILGIFANKLSTPSFSIGIINGANAPHIITSLENTDGITLADTTDDSIKIDLITGKFSAIVSFSNSDYELYSVKDEDTNMKLRQIIDTYKTTNIPVDIEELIGFPMSIAERTTAFMVLFLMVTATVTASLMIKDKNNGTLTRYKYAPQNSLNYIMGNFIYNYLITFLQFFISITFIQVVNVDIGIGYIDLIFIGIWISGIATAFGTFFSSLFQKEMYANLFATLTALILSLIGGTFISFDKMPDMLQRISIFSPLRWFIDVIGNMENGGGWLGNIGEICILTGMIFILLLGGCVVNKGLLRRK